MYNNILDTKCNFINNDTDNQEWIKNMTLIRLKYNNFRKLHSKKYFKKLNIKKFEEKIEKNNLLNYPKDDLFIYENRFNLNKNFYVFNSSYDNCHFSKINCNICIQKSFIPNWICNTCNNEICYFCIDKIYKSSQQNNINFNCAFCRNPINNIPKYRIQTPKYEYNVDEPNIIYIDNFIVPDDNYLYQYNYRISKIRNILLKIFYYINFLLCMLIFLYFSLIFKFSRVFYFIDDHVNFILYITLTDFI